MNETTYRIKPLVWSFETKADQASALGVCYWVLERYVDQHRAWVEGPEIKESDELLYDGNSHEDAVAACEADHRARLLTMLDLVTT